MSARNPTDFNHFVNLLNLRTGKQIKTTEPSEVTDDQMFVLDKEELVVSTVFQRIEATGGAFVDKFKLYLDSKDMCGDASVSNDEIAHSFYALCAVETGGTTGEIRLTSALASANATSTITVNSTTIQWLKGDSINIKTNANEDTLTVAMRRTAGASNVRLWGVAVWADET